MTKKGVIRLSVAAGILALVIGFIFYARWYYKPIYREGTYDLQSETGETLTVSARFRIQRSFFDATVILCRVDVAGVTYQNYWYDWHKLDVGTYNLPTAAGIRRKWKQVKSGGEGWPYWIYDQDLFSDQPLDGSAVCVFIRLYVKDWTEMEQLTIFWVPPKDGAGPASIQQIASGMYTGTRRKA